MVIETVNQAMNALDAYWANHEMPDHRVIAQIREKLQEHSSGCDDDWQALLETALHDLSYQIGWHGETIQGLTQGAEDKAPDPLSGSF